MMVPQIDICVDGMENSIADSLEDEIQAAVAKTVKVAGLRMHEAAELSILLADDAKLQHLNQQWRQIDKPTNVLSFPAAQLDPGDTADSILGDIVISVETTKREADLENKSFNDHFTHLIVHGFLHLFGYDHETEEQALVMEALETKILGELGIDNPYESRQTL